MLIRPGKWVRKGIGMPGTIRVEIRTLKVGRYLAIDDDAYRILSISKSKPGKHGSAKARIELEDLFTGQKRSHVGSVSDTVHVPVIEKGSATVTHLQGEEVHAMDAKTFELMVLPDEESLNVEAGGEIMWMEAMGRFKIIRDH
jgi:translation initiation factor 5A